MKRRLEIERRVNEEDGGARKKKRKYRRRKRRSLLFIVSFLFFFFFVHFLRFIKVGRHFFADDQQIRSIVRPTELLSVSLMTCKYNVSFAFLLLLTYSF